MVVALVELVEQARARDGVRPWGRDVEFGGEDGVGHWGIIGNGGVVGYGVRVSVFIVYPNWLMSIGFVLPA